MNISKAQAIEIKCQIADQLQVAFIINDLVKDGKTIPADMIGARMSKKQIKQAMDLINNMNTAIRGCE